MFGGLADGQQMAHLVDFRRIVFLDTYLVFLDVDWGLFEDELMGLEG